jgi:hypothetical protein
LNSGRCARIAVVPDRVYRFALGIVQRHRRELLDDLGLRSDAAVREHVVDGDAQILQRPVSWSRNGARMDPRTRRCTDRFDHPVLLLHHGREIRHSRQGDPGGTRRHTEIGVLPVFAAVAGTS